MRRAAPFLGAGALALLAAACADRMTPGQCFEPNVTAYGFALNGDTNLVFHWPASYLPVRVYAAAADSLPENVQAAMSLWVGAFRCHELSLVATTDSTKADIIVRNPPSLPPAPPAARLMHADSVGACNGVTHVELNSAGDSLAGPIHSYVAPAPSVTDTTAIHACYHFVTAHELGHALGLFDHDTADATSLMYPQPRHRQLNEADRYTIQLLYHTTSKLGPPRR